MRGHPGCDPSTKCTIWIAEVGLPASWHDIRLSCCVLSDHSRVDDSGAILTSMTEMLLRMAFFLRRRSHSGLHLLVICSSQRSKAPHFRLLKLAMGPHNCHDAIACFQSSCLCLSLERSVPVSCHTIKVRWVLRDCCAEALDCTAVCPRLRGDVLLSAVDFHCSTISDDLQQVPSPPIILHMVPPRAIRTAADLKRSRSADCRKPVPPPIRPLALDSCHHWRCEHVRLSSTRLNMTPIEMFSAAARCDC